MSYLKFFPDKRAAYLTFFITFFWDNNKFKSGFIRHIRKHLYITAAAFAECIIRAYHNTHCFKTFSYYIFNKYFRLRIHKLTCKWILDQNIYAKTLYKASSLSIGHDKALSRSLAKTYRYMVKCKCC